MPLPRPNLALLPVFAALLTLAACSEQPDLDSHVTDAARAAPYPDLVPLEPLLATSAPRPDGIETAQTDLAARRDRLQRRARRLNAAVIDAGTEKRMRAGVDPLPAP